jgi:hypothetical protein
VNRVQGASLRWGPRAVATRSFTPSEANSALERVRPLAERMVAVRARLGELESEQREVVKIIAGNGSGYGVGEARTPEFSRLAGELEDCINQLNALGVEVKDAEIGLLDFPARREGEDVLLCWRIGEDAVEWWHDPEEGFAGRKRIDWE